MVILKYTKQLVTRRIAHSNKKALRLPKTPKPKAVFIQKLNNLKLIIDVNEDNVNEKYALLI